MLAAFRARVHAELVGDDGTRLLVDAQGFSLPARPVEGSHEQQPQLFLERLIGEQPAQVGDGEAGAIAADVRLDAQFQRAQTQLIQPLGLGIDEGRRRNVGQRLAAPQGEGVGEQLGGPLGIAGR